MSNPKRTGSKRTRLTYRVGHVIKFSETVLTRKRGPIYAGEIGVVVGASHAAIHVIIDIERDFIIRWPLVEHKFEHVRTNTGRNYPLIAGRHKVPSRDRI